ncbi:MAG TPA: FemAB family XrtA/PEP-CTERM system-associated protein [Stellaceae bacterium]|jgi:FemAB-related protein (PEP-CTERM system-associated)
MDSISVAAVSVRELPAERIAAWDAYASAHPHGTFFHRAGWRDVIEKSFGHKTHYLLAEREGGAVCGVLPLVHVHSRLFGNTLASSAFCVYGGPIADDDATLGALDARAVDLMRSLGADCLEYRSLQRRHPDWPCKDSFYVTFRREIVEDPDQNLKAIPRKQRAVVRQSLERGLRYETDATVDRFFPIYAASVRNHGTPVFARSFFRNIKETFGEDCEVGAVVAEDGTPVSAVMSFYFRDEVLPYYGGGLPAARKLGGFDFMYWQILRNAGERGLKIFDFGRSKVGTGSFSFKKNWGFTAQPIFHEYQLKPGGSIPEVNPLNPKYRLFIETWKRLPMPVANAIGPFVARNLG